jgi:hypothetical protein
MSPSSRMSDLEGAEREEVGLGRELKSFAEA